MILKFGNIHLVDIIVKTSHMVKLLFDTQFILARVLYEGWPDFSFIYL